MHKTRLAQQFVIATGLLFFILLYYFVYIALPLPDFTTQKQRAVCQSIKKKKI